MKFLRIGPNVTELEFRDGTKVLVSFEIPAAAYIPNVGYVRTDRFISRTTQDHVTRWIRKAGAVSSVMAHEHIEQIMGER